MKISRLRIKNFRNLADIDLPLGSTNVIVGENRVGKSNLTHALRILFDPSLPNSDRHLRTEDFWDGLSAGQEDYDPKKEKQEITISVDIEDFADDERVSAVLADALVSRDPLRARITYKYGPRVIPGTEEDETVYNWVIYRGSDDGNLMPAELRGYLHLAFLHALRDVESDVAGWRRSPLRQLLEAASEVATPAELSRIAAAVEEANNQVSQLSAVKSLGENITSLMVDMVGSSHALEAELGVASTDPQRLIRTLRVFVDGDSRRPLSSASLGTLNVLYFALMELGIQQKLLKEIAHFILAIEEPEAHLHPHLQRLIFKRLIESADDTQTVFVTTQSPHIASSAGPRNLILLRNEGGATKALAASEANLTKAEWDDISRYLDVTRAEVIFARRVLLVEGYAEQAIIPHLAQAHGFDLDKSGVSVCAIHGVHFLAYLKFCRALGIPCAAITDGDIQVDKKGHKRQAGKLRAQRFMTALGENGSPSDSGIFVGGTTFEYDLLQATDRNLAESVAALKELAATPKTLRDIELWGDADPGYYQCMSMIKRVGGKGRYANSLMSRQMDLPDYLRSALEYVVGQ
ncbi:ATP-dependent nuclease [Streptomyces sp. NBC_01257]|uniref:ATP-dependent nuclease n=1 Tax=Streptomyces sp. NBC_01257 TaxID=2903799 RepID=UPI002DD85634|nr:AAA family ATPase [Streptomyces sp. NBC_01257]WRZ66108.1 AAA family ATPase [Streptomyces sp. NBC_01257]